MTREQSDGTVCPFCLTAVPSYVSVCAGCGAVRGTRAESLKPGAALVRAGIWANTLGLILFFSAWMALKPWFDPTILQNGKYVCLTTVKYRVPAAYSFLIDQREKTVYMEAQAAGEQACEDVADHKKAAFEEGLKAAMAKKNPTYTIISARSHTTREIIPGSRTTWRHWFEVLIRSVIPLLAGALLFGVAKRIWVRLLGRLRDPIWIRR